MSTWWQHKHHLPKAEAYKHFKIGDRVQTHPATDAWMRGDRYGTVVYVGPDIVQVALDKSGWRRGFHFTDLSKVD